jgi:hypothetical protein
MSLRPLQIVFHVDGTGVYYDPREPLMLDGILAWCLAPFHCDRSAPPSRDELPAEIPLPLGRWYFNGQWGWRASALFPDEDLESVIWSRKRFRIGRAELTTGNPNLQGSVYHDRNIPLALNLSRAWTCWAFGNRKEVRRLLQRDLRYLGRKRSAGHGRIVDVTVEWCDEDLSVVRAGLAQRYLPSAAGLRVVRPRPPYWNRMGAVPCCEVGEPFAITSASPPLSDAG